MADEQQANALSAIFPAPPPFFAHFTPTNLERIAEARSAASAGSSSDKANSSAVDATLRADASLSRELQHLIPPAIPDSQEFRSFGETFNLSNPLPHPPAAASDIQGLDLAALPQTPHYEIQPTLLRLVRSLMLSFLELVSLLSANPASAEGKLRDIETLFTAAHTLVNEYRPHQARETLIELMEKRITQSQREMEDLQAMEKRVDEVLGSLGGDAHEGERAAETQAQEASTSKTKSQNEQSNRIWDVLDTIEVPAPG